MLINANGLASSLQENVDALNRLLMEKDERLSLLQKELDFHKERADLYIEKLLNVKGASRSDIKEPSEVKKVTKFVPWREKAAGLEAKIRERAVQKKEPKVS